MHYLRNTHSQKAVGNVRQGKKYGREYYDTLVITGRAESQPNGSFYAITEAAKIHKKRELYQQKNSQQSVTKRQKTCPEPDSQHTEINSPVSSDIEDIDSIIQQSTQTGTGID